MTDNRPRKRSLTIGGHRTSLSVEDAFWSHLNRIAAERGLSLSALVTQIDADRKGIGLSGALRLFVLDNLEQQLISRQDGRQETQG